MAKPNLHMMKLSVGSESVTDLAAWQTRYGDGPARHVTRMWPKREAELLAGGSIYWVIKGIIQARQKIIGFEEVIGADDIRRCAILIDRALIRTEPAPRRAFQGWRYLKPEDAPRDLPQGREAEPSLPRDLALALADIGLR